MILLFILILLIRLTKALESGNTLLELGFSCIRIKDKLICNMDIFNPDAVPPGKKAPSLFTLEGRVNDFSTRALHAHDCHQLLRINSGTTLLEEKTWQQPLFADMTAFIPKGLPHRSVVLGGPVRYQSMYFFPGRWNPGLKSIRIFDLSSLGRALFDRICHARKRPGPEQIRRKCQDLLFTLLDDEINKTSSITRIPVPREKDNLRLVAFIKDHFQEKLTLNDFSRVVNYSPRQVTRRFKADVGMTLFEFLRLYRIFRAAVLLSTEKGPVAQTAFAVGYESLSCFYKDFKAIFSTAPKAFCKRHLSKG